MIKEYEYLHGVVFSRLCNVYGTSVSIRPYTEQGYSSYVVNDVTGLYIKYSGKRLNPWRFSFTEGHQNEILRMHQEYGQVFIALVCNIDGVVVLSYKEFKEILDEEHSAHEWVSVSRTKRKMYSVAGSDGKLEYKISRSSCPDKIIDYVSGANSCEQTSGHVRSASFFPRLLSFLSG